MWARFENSSGGREYTIFAESRFEILIGERMKPKPDQRERA